MHSACSLKSLKKITMLVPLLFGFTACGVDKGPNTEPNKEYTSSSVVSSSSSSLSVVYQDIDSDGIFGSRDLCPSTKDKVRLFVFDDGTLMYFGDRLSTEGEGPGVLYRHVIHVASANSDQFVREIATFHTSRVEYYEEGELAEISISSPSWFKHLYCEMGTPCKYEAGDYYNLLELDDFETAYSAPELLRIIEDYQPTPVVAANGCSSMEVDSDRDGVTDNLDLCKDTPEAAEVTVDGCSLDEADSDFDGINDTDDECPYSVTTEVEEDGCVHVASSSSESSSSSTSSVSSASSSVPIEDDDGDGIANERDECADTKGIRLISFENGEHTFFLHRQRLTDEDEAEQHIFRHDVYTTRNAESRDPGDFYKAQALFNFPRDHSADGSDETEITLLIGDNAFHWYCIINECEYTIPTYVDLIEEGEQHGDNVIAINENYFPPFRYVLSNGCSYNQIDEDVDGVSSLHDMCPSTPSDEEANIDGCSASQLDTDKDGIRDSIDQCPNSLASSDVNLVGCVDEDNDGIEDEYDMCPATVLGKGMTWVNENGCGRDQVDSDSDGVFDLFDECEETPVDEPVGRDGCGENQADSDLDGVIGPHDLCPGTPKGEEVDEDGCGATHADTDGDKIYDVFDRCPETSDGHTVDGNGCSEYQKDSDGDSIVNAIDACPETPASDSVDESGCSIGPKDSDQDGVADTLDECADSPAGEPVDAQGCPLPILDGEALFVDNCSACHGLDGTSSQIGTPIAGMSEEYVLDVLETNQLMSVLVQHLSEPEVAAIVEFVSRMPTETKPDPELGALILASDEHSCKNCHGSDRKGTYPITKDALVAKNHTDESLMEKISSMNEAYNDGLLTEVDISNLAAYLLR